MFTGLLAHASTTTTSWRACSATRSATPTPTTSFAMQTAGAAWNVAALVGVLLAAMNPVLAAGAIAAAQTAQLKYSREFEQEADYLGLRR